MLDFKCDFCSFNSAIFVLPCLHTGCEKCLQHFEREESTDGSDTDSGIVPCSICDMRIPVSKDGIIKGFKPLVVNSGDMTDSNIRSVKTCDHLCLNELQTDIDVNGSLEPITADSTEVKTSTAEDAKGWGQHFHKNTVNFKHYCCECDMIICTNCSTTENCHAEHKVVGYDNFVRHKRDYLNELLTVLTGKVHNKQIQFQQTKCLSDHLTDTFEKLKDEIQQRANHLCEVIIQKKDSMIKKLAEVMTKKELYYKSKGSELQSDIEVSNSVYNFADSVVKNGKDVELINLHNEISARLSDLVNETEETVQVSSVKVDLPEKGKEELYLDKFFGEIMQGEVVCGKAELLSTMTCDLNWPVAMDVTDTYEYLVTGKCGAFEQEGQIFGYDRKGRLCLSYKIQNQHLPCDIIYTKSNKILLTISEGMLYVLTKNGLKVDSWKNVFSGSGKIAEGKGHIYITSSKEGTINKFSADGKLLCKIEMTDNLTKLKPHLIGISGNVMAVTGEDSGRIYFADLDGNITTIYDSMKDQEKPIACASALCFDPFGNLLVSDFSTDSICLISSQGYSLGHLLSKKQGISCPNCITFDKDGNVLIGQYGGDIKVYRYLSCEKYT